jgi:hypothetical protein
MKKEDFLKLGLTEEQATKAAEASAEELKGFIPKSRFDEVNEVKKRLEEDLKKRDQQLEELKKLNPEKLQEEINRLQEKNKQTQKQYEEELSKIKLENAIEKALINAKAKNIKAVKALLDLEKVELDGETVKGLDDQIKKLTEGEDTKFLFDVAGEKPNFKGIKPGEKTDKSGNNEQPKTLADAIRAHFETQ